MEELKQKPGRHAAYRVTLWFALNVSIQPKPTCIGQVLPTLGISHQSTSLRHRLRHNSSLGVLFFQVTRLYHLTVKTNEDRNSCQSQESKVVHWVSLLYSLRLYCHENGMVVFSNSNEEIEEHVITLVESF